ncbi:hypothetical protein C0992_010158 [Termitomyces sp. T32_za158]|nr:hypothetical protein C0992_010158 [Termitomyces sp. T32_za158]
MLSYSSGMSSNTIESLSNLHTDSSPFSSPVRKRQRLSSPTYDEQLANFNQADLDALEQLEAHFSQSPRKSSSQIEEAGHTVELTNDPENPFTTASNASSSFLPASVPNFAAASALTNTSVTPLVGFGFSKASAIDVSNFDTSDDAYRSPSPEEPPNQDYEAWFEPAGAIPPITFQFASSSLLPPAGLVKASNKGFIAPSSAALAKAQEKMRDIWQDHDSLDTSPEIRPSTPSTKDNSENLFQLASNLSRKSPRRPALQPVVNSPGINSPSTPSPAGFSRPLTKPSSAMTPTELFISKNSKPFKSPLLPKKTGTSTSVDYPRSAFTTPNRLGGFVTTKSQHPLASAPITADFSPLTTPARHPKAFSTGSSVRKRVPTAFVTPFKPGMEPGQPGRLKLSQITPSMAMYYSFHTPSSMPVLPLSSTPPVKLGPVQAFNSLLECGCSLATQDWVDNHWGLILWKLAGMVGLDPERERLTAQKRWCWNEVMRQLFYR